MDIKAKNSITDRVQFTGIVVNDDAWIQGGSESWQSEGRNPDQSGPVTYVGPERRQRREQPTTIARSA